MIIPTLKYTSFGMPRASAAAIAPIMPSGTIVSTDSGIVQLSYSAASAMNTASTDSPTSSGVCRAATCSSRAASNFTRLRLALFAGGRSTSPAIQHAQAVDVALAAEQNRAKETAAAKSFVGSSQGFQIESANTSEHRMQADSRDSLAR
ncbi:hypothetical protein TQ36_29145 [Burkholderia cenocepacia]|nr:hypothetical protein TQ36_29145 [Burkholderia cenocepacia]